MDAGPLAQNMPFPNDEPAPLLPGGLRPREYQLELFRRALQDNAIVLLETGTGKTLVAVMLIQWFAQRATSMKTAATAITAGKESSQIGLAPRRRQKVRVFLNNTVALAHQQARVIAENSSQKVKELVGSMSIDEWDEARWTAEWEGASVLVMIHQVLLNALRAGLVRISDIDLLVFDECHHARRHHPYSMIMREFYDHCPPHDRPHIFGMTASPLNSHQTASDSAMHLRAMLDSSICTVDLTASLDAPPSQPQSICYEYMLPPDYAATPLTLALSAQCGGSSAIAAGLKAAPAILSLLGPFGVDQMWHHYIHQWHRKTRQRPAPPMLAAHKLPPLSSPLPGHHLADGICSVTFGAQSEDAVAAAASTASMDIDDVIAAELKPQTALLHPQPQPQHLTPDLNGSSIGTDSVDDVVYLKQALAIDHHYGGSALTCYSTSLTSTMRQTRGLGLGSAMETDAAVGVASTLHPLAQLHDLLACPKPWSEMQSSLSPQANRLLDILYQWRTRSSELRGIVFTARRMTAVLLVYIISQISEFSFIRADVLLGASQKAGSTMDRPIRSGSVRNANQLTLADFANGSLNLIFATQVAEEGVDIQPCNVVVRFDLPKTATSLIQSRGRARMVNSQFIVMVPEMDQDERSAAEHATGLEANIVSALPNGEAPQAIASVPGERAPTIPEHARSFTDYMKLISLERCMREWCLTEAQASERLVSDGVAATSNSHVEYGRLLRRLRLSLTLDDDPLGSDTSEPWVESKDATGRIYMIKSTLARITYSSAISLIYRYVQNLPQDVFCTLVPVFEFEEVVQRNELLAVPTPVFANNDGGIADYACPKKKKAKRAKPTHVTLYRCKITLPANATLRQVTGPLMPSKKAAKQVAAFRTAKKLHQLGVIDDNLVPISESTTATLAPVEIGDEDGFDLSGASGSKGIKGARSSVSQYETAIPEQFVPPTCTPATLLSSDDDESTSSVNSEYVPFPWHLYLLALRHPDSRDPVQIILATARKLPTDTAAPLYIAQYAAGLTELNTEVTQIVPRYVGSQALSCEQVDLLASFSSKLLMRVLHIALAWETASIGTLLAPPVVDGSGVDFELAESMFRDRSRIQDPKNGSSDLTRWTDKMVMDMLDFGRLKIVDRVCENVDIYSNLAEYHYAHVTRKAGKLAGPSSMMQVDGSSPSTDGVLVDTDGARRKLLGSCTGTTKRSKDGASIRSSIQAMADWAAVKRIAKMLPKVEDGCGVPLFHTKTVNLTYNYLLVSSAHLQPSATTLAAEVDLLDQSAAMVGDSSTIAFPDVIYSSPFFCAPEPIDLPALNSLSVLPAFFVRLGQTLMASAVKARLGLHAHTETVRQAITASCASMDVNYERLETLGDSVLKLISSTMLFVSRPDEHEGLLTQRRRRIVSNANLFALSRRLGLAEYMITQSFVRRDLRMPGKGWLRMPAIPSKWVCTLSPAKQLGGADDESQQSTTSSASGTSQSGTSSSGSSSPTPNQQQRERPRQPPVHQINTKRPLSDKAVADVIEALLGASMVDGGISGALAAARSMGIVGPTWTSWSSFSQVWRETMATREAGLQQLNSSCQEIVDAASAIAEDMRELELEAKLDQEDILYGQPVLDCEHFLGHGVVCQSGSSMSSERQVDDVERILGYKFKNRSLLAEALTHCSSTDLRANSYQRLEYLGDAVIDYFITQRYYDHLPELRPHRITLVKHVACSNDLFALVVVCHGLHQHVRHGSDALAASVRDYEFRLNHAKQTWLQSQDQSPVCLDDMDISDEDSAYCKSSTDVLAPLSWTACASQDSALSWPVLSQHHHDKRQKICVSQSPSNDMFWGLPPECWNVVQAPKVLGDVFESLLGAVFVDSGMDMAAAEQLYQRMLCPFLDRFVDSGRLSLHPVIQSLLICQGWGCDMISWGSKENPDQLEYVGKYICEVKAHGIVLAAATGETPRHAKFNAASALLSKIGAVSPNALHGDLDALHSLPDSQAKDTPAGGSKLDRLLKPVCTCIERRRAEAAAAAAARAEAEEDARV
ncbi:Dicer-like protein 1 [Coemansia sp. RSA 2322]|nr:Dicer-like protein 1 [Coemansia sp. RSA 2322]